MHVTAAARDGGCGRGQGWRVWEGIFTKQLFFGGNPMVSQPLYQSLKYISYYNAGPSYDIGVGRDRQGQS